MYNYCYELTLQDYWRLSFSATCSTMGAICYTSSAYCSSVQLAASPLATTSTGTFGKYDFMKASTWFGMDFARSPSGWGLPSVDPPKEQSSDRQGGAPAASRWGARLPRVP
jgi:hypothetical protein